MEQRTPFDSIVVGEGGLLIWASFMEGTAKSKLKKLTSRSTLLDDVAGRGRATHDAMVAATHTTQTPPVPERRFIQSVYIAGVSDSRTLQMMFSASLGTTSLSCNSATAKYPTRTDGKTTRIPLTSLSKDLKTWLHSKHLIHDYDSLWYKGRC